MRWKTVAVAVLTGGVMAAAAHAQERQGAEEGAPEEAQQQAAVLAETTAGNLMGLEVRGTGGEPLGSVRDLVVDPRQGRISQVVIATGGFLGIGEKRVAVPWEEVRLTREGVSVPLTPDDMREAPPFVAETATRPPTNDTPAPAPEGPPAD